MTLTVRLDDTLSSALELYCAERGVTKSLVVQQSLTAYLVTRQAAPEPSAPRPDELSANYRAFAAAGLIGSVALGHGADKAGVRARIAERLAERKARRGGGA